MIRSFVRAALAGLAVFASSGCVVVSGAPMTPQVIQEAGTHTFAAPLPKVFAATKSALESEGYPIALAAIDKGLIKTGQRTIRAVAQGNAYSAVAVEITRQYVVHVTQSGGATVVVAEPRIFQGNDELTDRPIWDLDSPAGERALWQRLFRDVQEAL
jgi:hypothetical protein